MRRENRQLRVERVTLSNAAALFDRVNHAAPAKGPGSSAITRPTYSTAAMCRLLGSPSGYHSRAMRQPSRRAKLMAH